MVCYLAPSDPLTLCRKLLYFRFPFFVVDARDRRCEEGRI
jgi:hypothetical protein